MKNNNSSTSQDDSTYLISLDNCLSAQHNDVDNLDPEYLDTGEETGKLDEEIQYLLLDNTYDAENCPLSESDITILLKLLKTKSDQYNQQQDKNTSVLYSVSNSDVEKLFQIINLKQEIINKTIDMKKSHRFLIPYCLDNSFHWNLLDIDITTDLMTENAKVICQMWDTDGKAKPLEISLFKKLTNLFGEIESIPNVECTNLKDSYAYLPDLQYNNNCGIVIALFAHYFLYGYSNWEDIDNLISGSTTSDLNLSETELSNPKFTLRQKVNKLIKENCNQEDKTNYCNLERANINNVTITDFEFNTTEHAHIKIKEKLQSISFENILSLYNSTSNNVDMDAIRELATSIKYTKDNIEFIFKDSLHEELNPIAVNAINKVFTERNSAIDSINSTSNNLPGIIDTRNNTQNIGMQESFENDNQQNMSNISPRKSKQAKNNLYSTESGPSFNLTTMKNELAGVIDNSGTILNYEFTQNQSDNIHKVLREMLSKKFLYNHQADAVILAIAANFNKTGFLLADAPGIGKTRTIIALSYLYKVLEEKNTYSLAIICVQNQAQKEFFQREIKVLSESLNKDSISDLKVLTKSEISKDENSDDLSKCLILTIDEVHNFYTQQDIINSLNEKKDTSLKKLMGKINRENTGLVLASATPTHNLEETKLILRLIFPYNKPAKVEQILSAKDDSTLSKNISYLLPPLLSEYGVIVTRMLRDNAYIAEGFGYNQQKKYLLEQILTDEIKDKLEEYNKIISEINNIRSQLHTHNKPLIFNLVFFSLVNRLQDDILIRYKIAETRKEREVNKEYRCIICINEYNDRAVIPSLKKSLGKNNLSNINLGNLEKYYNDFQLITKKSFDGGQNDVTFNPATIDAKMGIVVLTRKELTGTNKNTLLTNNNPVFRNANFHLELCHIGHARSEVELDQASGRLTRASNADDVEYGKHYSVSQINFARFSSRNHDDQRLHLQSFKNFTTNQGKLQKILEYASNQQQKISEIFGKNVSKDRLLLETMFLQTEHVKKFDLFLTSLERQIQIYEDNILKQERDLIYDDDGIVFITKNNDDSDNTSTNIICDIQASNNFLFIFNMMFESQPNYISDNNKNTFVCWNIRKTRFDKISSLLNPEILHIIAHKFNQNSALSIMDLLQKESTSGINDHSLDTMRGITSNRGNTTINSIKNRHQNQPAHKRKFIQSNSEKQYIPPSSMNKRTKDESEARIRHQENISRNSSINYEDYDHFSTCREYDALMTEYLNSNHNFENCLGNFLVSSGYEKLGKINGITHGGLNIYHYFVKNNNEFGTLKYLKQAEEYRKATQETEYNWLGILTSMNDGHASPYRGWSLLHFAVYESDLESVTYICQEAQQIINLKTKDNFQDNSTALHIAFSTLNEEHNKNKKNKDSNKINVTVNIIKTLLKNGADPQILEKTYRGQNKHITDLCSTDIIQKYFSTEKELVEKLLTRNRDRQAHTARDHGEHSNSDVSSDSESFHNLYILQQAAANILQQGNSLNHLTKELGKANAKEDFLKENSSTRKQEANICNDYFLHNFRKSIENELEKQKAEQEARKIRIDDLLRRDIDTTDTNTYEILIELVDSFDSLTSCEKDLKKAVLEKIYSVCIEKKPVLFNPYNQKLVDFLKSLYNEDKKRFIDIYNFKHDECCIVSIIFGEDFTREHFLGLFYDENGVPLTAKINDKLGYKICLGNSEYDATPLLIAIKHNDIAALSFMLNKNLDLNDELELFPNKEDSSNINPSKINLIQVLLKHCSLPIISTLIKKDVLTFSCNHGYLLKCLTKVSLGQVFNNEVRKLIIGNFLDSFLTSDSNTKNNIVFNPDDLFWVFDKVITHKAIDNQKKHEILKGIIENLIECSPTDSREDIGYNIDLVLNIATLAILRDKEDILYHILTNFLGYIKSRGADCSYYFEPIVLGLIVRAHNWGLPNIILSLYNKYYFDFTDIKNKHYYLPIDLQDLENSILRIRSSCSETTIDCIIEHAKKIHNISKCALEKLTDLHKESIKDPLKMELLQQNLRKIMNGEVIEGFNSELISLLDLIVNIPEIKLNGTDDKLNKLLKYLFFKDESLFFALSHLNKKDFFDIDLDLTKAKSELIALQDKQKRSLDNPNEVKITTGLENTGVNNNSQQEIFPGHEEEMTEYPREKKRSLSIEQDSATIIKTGENDVLNGGAINENKPGPELGKKTHLSLFGGTGYEEEKQSNINNNFTEIIDLTGSDKNSYNISDNSSPITIASSPENSEGYNSHQNSENIEKTTPNIHEATVKENRNSFFHNSSGNTYMIIDSEDEYNTASEGEDSMTHS